MVDPPPAVLPVAAGVAAVGELVVVDNVDGLGLSGCWPPFAAGLPEQSPLNQLCNVVRSDGEHVGQTAAAFEDRGVRKVDRQKHEV